MQISTQQPFYFSKNNLTFTSNLTINKEQNKNKKIISQTEKFIKYDGLIKKIYSFPKMQKYL